MKTATRWRRLLVGAMVVTCALLGVLATGAAAENRLERIYEIQSTLRSANLFPGIQDVGSYGTTEYVAFWESGGELAITARTPQEEGRGAVTRRLTGEVPPSLNDTSNAIAFARSNDGRIHVSYREAEGGHRYLESEGACSIETCRFTGRENQVPRTTQEWEISHPAYIHDNEGHLFFTYRHGPDANGEQELNRYNENGTWTRIGTIIWGGGGYRYSFDPDGEGPVRTLTTTQRGPLVNDIRFDEANDMVVTWVWDENTSAIDNAMHGEFFAWSRDLGVNWYDNNSTRIGTAETNAIAIEDESTQVVADEPGYFLVPGTMKLDSEGNPHIVTTESTVKTGDALLSNQRQVHFWRSSDLRWHAQWIERSGGSTHPSQAGVLFDRRDGMHAIYASGELGWRAWNADQAAQNDLPQGNIRWEAPGYMNAWVHSAATCLDSEYVGVPIATGRGATAVVNVRMKNSTSARDFTINWTTDEDPVFSHTKETHFIGVLTAEDREYREYSLTMSSELWRGTLRQLEICPAEGATTGRVSIDSIRLHRRETLIDASEWGFAAGRRIMTAEADATNEWERWHIESLIPELSDSWGDGDWSPDERIYELTLGRSVPIVTVEQGGVMKAFDVELHLYDPATLADWRFETTTESWSIGGDIGGGWFESRGVKMIGGSITGSDPRIYSRTELGLRVPFEETPPRFKILLNNESEATLARIWYTNTFEPEFTTSHSITFAIRPFSGEGYYEITARPEQWLGRTIKRLRIDPVDDGTSRGTFGMDRFWF